MKALCLKLDRPLGVAIGSPCQVIVSTLEIGRAPRRATALVNTVKALVSAYRPDLVCYDIPGRDDSKGGTPTYAHLRAALTEYLAGTDLPSTPIVRSDYKKAALGTGSASVAELEEWARLWRFNVGGPQGAAALAMFKFTMLAAGIKAEVFEQVPSKYEPTAEDRAFTRRLVAKRKIWAVDTEADWPRNPDRPFYLD